MINEEVMAEQQLEELVDIANGGEEATTEPTLEELIKQNKASLQQDIASISAAIDQRENQIAQLRVSLQRTDGALAMLNMLIP